MGRRVIILLVLLITAALVSGCTVIKSDIDLMSSSSTSTSLSASYSIFTGPLAQTMELKAGEKVTFSLVGGEGLQFFVIKGGKQLIEITDGAEFNVPEDGQYDFTAQGSAKDGSFTLSWAVE